MFKTSLPAAQAFSQLVTQANASKQYLLGRRALMVAPTCDAAVPLSVIQHFMQVVPMINTWAATPGIAAYAQSQYDDPGYNVVSEFVTMRDAMTAALNGLQSAFPADGSGWLLYQKFTAGVLTNRTFTAAQLAAAVSLIDAVIAAIE